MEIVRKRDLGTVLPVNERNNKRKKAATSGTTIPNTKEEALEPMFRPVPAVVRLHNVSWKFAGPPRTSANDPAQHFFSSQGPVVAHAVKTA